MNLLAVALVLCGAALARAADQDRRLVDAARRQDHAAVAALLKQRADVNGTQGDRATALHWAAHWDALDTAELLLAAGANANAANDLGITPLWLASMNGSGAMVQRLLAAGAAPNVALPSGQTPLMAAARTGSVEAVRALIARGADVNAVDQSHQQTALMWAIAERHADTARLLIEQGANIQARSRSTPLLVNRGGRQGVGEIPKGGFTPLLFAARSGDVASATLLLDAGAPVDDASPDGATALIVAAHSGHGELAALLLARGANPNRGEAGYTPLHVAVLRGDLTLVQSLLGRGADPNARVTRGTPVPRFGQDYSLSEDVLGATPFALAAKYVEVDIMRALAAGGADPRLPMEDGTTPLMAAAGIGWTDGGAGGGADRRGRFYNLVATAEAADWNRTLAAASLAIELGADVNAANQTGDTALHGAALKGFDPVIRLLVERGAQVEARNRRGQTPLRIATGRAPSTAAADTLKSTAELLKQLGAKQ